MTQPRDPSAAHRTARRAAAKQHHPDRGGSAEALDAALRAVDRQHRAAAHVTPVHSGTGRESTPRTMLGIAVGRLRRLIPGSVRRSRRYITL